MATKEMEKAQSSTEVSAEIMEKVALDGDLSQLSPSQRVAYYTQLCESLGLNPYTKPFQYLKLQGKLTLYANKDAAEQLTRKWMISLEQVSSESTFKDTLYRVVYKASDPNGRHVDASGVVPIANLKGEALANALMKAETKARRRATLSLVGLGWLDETEIETIRSRKGEAPVTLVEVDEEGEIVEETPIQSALEEAPVEEAPQGNDAGDMYCSLHGTNWFQTSKGHAHPLTNKEGETLVNAKGYERWCSFPKDNMDSREFWIARQNLQWTDDDAIALLKCTFEEYQKLHDISSQNFGPVYRACIEAAAAQQ